MPTHGQRKGYVGGASGGGGQKYIAGSRRFSSRTVEPVYLGVYLAIVLKK